MNNLVDLRSLLNPGLQRREGDRKLSPSAPMRQPAILGAAANNPLAFFYSKTLRETVLPVADTAQRI